MINIQVIDELSKLKISFPEAVTQLTQIGIERYYTDLVQMQKIYYSREGETYIHTMSIDNLPKMAVDFNRNKFLEILRAVQRGSIDYPEFIRGIISNGAASYFVFIDGRQAIYMGRKGETHAEKFPF